MLDVLIVLLLVLGFFFGLKRGLILQVVRLAGFVAAYIVAYVYYDDIAPVLKGIIPYPLETTVTMHTWLEQVNVEDVFYQAIAFVILFIATKIVFMLAGNLLNMFAQIPVLKQVNSFGGALLGFLEVYVILFIVMFALSLFPQQHVQASFQKSVLPKLIVEDTPILSETVKELWVFGDKV
ncbi:CvpA family protein [Bacillus sp. 165]|uniref:CvpA family protein n=1 Tax=Bacillus sp. 165 TaxID=1529117 RepID=UPI001AD98B95|nr:CvpA family protein [Bacillus sp. 165]MBO9130581.1 CvpA family protein [Bacillus sp. 165]